MRRSRAVVAELTCVRLIAGETLRAAARQRIFAGVLLLAAGLTLGVLGLRDFNFGLAEARFVMDFGLAVLNLAGAVLAVAAATQAVGGEIEHRTALTLLAKPVSRAAFLAGKGLGVWLLLGAVCAFLGALTAGLLLRVPAASETVGWGNLALAVAALWLKFGVLTAIALLMTAIARSPLLALVLGFLVLAICQLQSVLQTLPRSAGPVRWAVTRALDLVFPDFSLFDLTEGIGTGEAVGVERLGWLSFYALIYTGVIGVLAIQIFRRREL